MHRERLLRDVIAVSIVKLLALIAIYALFFAPHPGRIPPIQARILGAAPHIAGPPR